MVTDRTFVSGPLETGLKKVTLRAMGWQSVATVTVQVLQAGATLTVAAHVAPSDFAIWGIASIVVNAQHLIGSLGLAPALVYFQAREWLRDGVDGAFLVTVVLGLIGAGALGALAPILASFFKEGFKQGEVVAALRAMSLVFLFLTIANVPQALIEKTLDFRRRALPEMAAVATYAALVLLLMLGGYGVWSLIIAKAVQSFLLALLYWIAAPVRPRALPRLRISVVRTLFRYGKFLTAAAVIGFLVGNLDTIAVGHVSGAAALGGYALAFTVTNLVPTFLSLTLGKVFFPLYAAIRDNKDELRRSFGAAVHYLGVVMLPTTAGLLTFVPGVLVTIFGEEWRPAMGLVRILALYGLARAVGSAMSNLLAAVGRPDLMLWAFGLSLAVPLTLLWPLHQFGATGIAWAFTAGQITAATFALSRTRGLWSGDLLGAVGFPALATGAALLALAGAFALTSGRAGGVWHVLLFGSAYLAVLVVFDRRVRELLAYLRARREPPLMRDSGETH